MQEADIASKTRVQEFFNAPRARRNRESRIEAKGGGRGPTEADHLARLKLLFRDYHQSGFTAVCDRGATPETIARYEKLRASGDLSVRVALSRTFPTVGAMSSILGAIDQIAASPLRKPDPLAAAHRHEDLGSMAAC